MRLADQTLTEILDRIAAPDPTPGGGSVAALAGACGAALAEMVAGLPRTRQNSDEERAALGALRAPLAAHRARLTALVDLDTDAFNALMAAFRLPKATDEEKAARRAAIQAATQTATLVPLETAELCARVLGLLTTVAAKGNPSAVSDMAVALGMLRAASDGAAANVRVNLDGITDEAFKTDTRAKLTATLAEVEAAAGQTAAALG